MEVKDLRIGNYISPLGIGVTKVEGFCIWDNLIQSSDFAERGIEDFEPIPITEEWLLKFGFKELNIKNRFITECGFEIEKQGFNYAYVLWGGEDAPFLTQFIGHCKYIHQLQNLYFSLTGKELAKV